MEIFRVDGGRSQELLKYALQTAPIPIEGTLSVSMVSTESVIRFAGLPSNLLIKVDSFDDVLGGIYKAELRIDSGNFQDLRANLDLLAQPEIRILEGKLYYDRGATVALTEAISTSVVGVVIYQKKGAYEEKFRPEGTIGSWLNIIEDRFPGCCCSRENLDNR